MMYKGFTLIELMVVIVIIGILAAVAVPKFQLARYKALSSEFPTTMNMILTAQTIHYDETSTYATVGNGNLKKNPDFNAELGIEIPTNVLFAYETWEQTNGVFKIRATLRARNLGTVKTGAYAQYSSSDRLPRKAMPTSSGPTSLQSLQPIFFEY